MNSQIIPNKHCGECPAWLAFGEPGVRTTEVLKYCAENCRMYQEAKKIFWVKKEERSGQLMYDFQHEKVVIEDPLWNEEEIVEEDEDYGFHHSLLYQRYSKVDGIQEVTCSEGYRREVVNDFDAY